MRENLDVLSEDDVLKQAQLTADAGYGAEANMKYVFEEDIDVTATVIPVFINGLLADDGWPDSTTHVSSRVLVVRKRGNYEFVSLVCGDKDYQTVRTGY